MIVSFSNLDFDPNPPGPGAMPSFLQSLFQRPPTSFFVELEGERVQVQRKPIRHLNLRLSAGGELKVSAPLRMSQAFVRGFLEERREWIQTQRAKLAARPAQTSRLYEDGETLPFLGRSLRLHWDPRGQTARAKLDGERLLLRAPATATRAQREAAVLRCLARELLAAAQALLPSRVADLGVETPTLRIRRMRSRWGTCAIRTKVITLALELAWREPEYLNYILVHELAHLRVRTHGPRFKALMDKHVPGWRGLRKGLS